MNYRIARDGQTFGPYTEAELREYLASGKLLETDLARTEEMDKWLPLSGVLRMQKNGKRPMRGNLKPAGLRAGFASPPDIPWWLALILDIITGLTFFVAWDIVEAVWLRRIEKNSRALFYYSIAALLFIVNAPALYSDVLHSLFHMGLTPSTNATWLSIAAFAMRIVARFSMRRTLCDHYNQTEPIGLKLSWFMTLLFGGLYFQYHFNRINALRRSVASGMARV
jgi:hypothetical protein